MDTWALLKILPTLVTCQVYPSLHLPGFALASLGGDLSTSAKALLEHDEEMLAASTDQIKI
eukprot:5696650-Amphidinium_carterae.1